MIKVSHGSIPSTPILRRIHQFDLSNVIFPIALKHTFIPVLYANISKHINNVLQQLHPIVTKRKAIDAGQSMLLLLLLVLLPLCLYEPSFCFFPLPLFLHPSYNNITNSAFSVPFIIYILSLLGPFFPFFLKSYCFFFFLLLSLLLLSLYILSLSLALALAPALAFLFYFILFYLFLFLFLSSFFTLYLFPCT